MLQCFYLSEQHKLGKLPRQHEAQIWDAQSYQGRPAQISCPAERSLGGEERKKASFLNVENKKIHKKADNWELL